MCSAIRRAPSGRRNACRCGLGRCRLAPLVDADGTYGVSWCAVGAILDNRHVLLVTGTQGNADLGMCTSIRRRNGDGRCVRIEGIGIIRAVIAPCAGLAAFLQGLNL